MTRDYRVVSESDSFILCTNSNDASSFITTVPSRHVPMPFQTSATTTGLIKVHIVRGQLVKNIGWHNANLLQTYISSYWKFANSYITYYTTLQGHFPRNS